MTDTPTPDSADVDARLSADLGFDVTAVEAEARARIELLRLQRGERSQLGWVLIQREQHPPAAVVFDSHAAAVAAIASHPLIALLRSEDATSISAPESIDVSDLAGREIIIPS